MFVAEGARKKILKKRQNTFFQEILPGIIREANRLEIPTEEVLDYILKFKGRE